MHDPMTVIKNIRLPIGGRKRVLKTGEVIRYRPLLAILWHIDPEIGGNDDSCGWFRPHLSAKEMEYVDSLITNEVDNLRDWIKSADEWDAIHKMRIIFRNFKQYHRPWWKHPRWHIHHWKLQIQFLLYLKRFLFSRCAKCGKHFRWGYSPTTPQWNNTGPRWFRGEKKVYHSEHMPRPIKQAND